MTGHFPKTMNAGKRDYNLRTQSSMKKQQNSGNKDQDMASNYPHDASGGAIVSDTASRTKKEKGYECKLV